MTPRFRIEDFTTSHVGGVRKENEDSVGGVPEAGIWVVADGMGGHANGRMASQTIVDAVGAIDPGGTVADAAGAVADAIHRANAMVFAKSMELGKQMGSTVVALVVRDHEFAVLWAGDSRAYLFRDGHLVQLSRDHTQVEDMVERGLLSPEEAEDHPMKHVLSRAVGVQEGLELDAIRDEVVSRDLFLLCSDGLHGVLEDAEIAQVLAARGAGAAEELIAMVLERGAPDNVSVTLVGASEPTLLNLGGTTF